MMNIFQPNCSNIVFIIFLDLKTDKYCVQHMSTAADSSLIKICFGSPVKSDIWHLRTFGSKPSTYLNLHSCQHNTSFLQTIMSKQRIAAAYSKLLQSHACAVKKNRCKHTLHIQSSAYKCLISVHVFWVEL